MDVVVVDDDDVDDDGSLVVDGSYCDACRRAQCSNFGARHHKSPEVLFQNRVGFSRYKGQLAVATCIPEVNDWSRSRHVVPGPATLKLVN